MKMQLDTVAQFVAWEESQEQKYEFCDGRVSLFPGGSLAHGTITANLIVALRLHGLPPTDVMPSDVKVVTDRASRYPDVMVLGDERDGDTLATFARYPRVLFEVLSPSTRSVDRDAKADNYLAIESLHTYVLVESTKRWAQTYCRVEDGWHLDFPITSGELVIATLKFSIPFDELYAGTGL